MQKNVASQKWVVFAFDRTDNTPKTGNADQITAKISIDTGAAGATDDTNPTEIEDGYYYFNLTQAETNGDMIHILPESSTGDIQVIGCPGVVSTTSLTHTRAGYIDELAAANIPADIDAIKEKTDNLPADPADDSDIDTQLAAIAAYIDTEVAAIKAVTDNLPNSGALTDIASAITTINGVVDDILTDTGTTIPGTITTMQGDVTDILEDTGTTLDALIKDVPTVEEFEARTIAAADYLVEGDTLARVTLVDTCTDLTNAPTAGDLTATMKTSVTSAVPTAAQIKTAIEAAGSSLDHLMKTNVYKLLITEASGDAELFNAAGDSQGTVAGAFTSIAGVTMRLKMIPA